MQLLVSVRDADEARAALAGGVEIIDAKEPARGALGAVTPSALQAIQAAVDDARPLSAALGDALGHAAFEDTVRHTAELGLAYVKIGFRGVRERALAAERLATAVRGAPAAGTGTQIIAVAYADAKRAASLEPEAILEVAASSGARGVLLDTACKEGGGLLTLMDASVIARWVRTAHDAGMVAALAGQLHADDVGIIRALGADIVGVRGAACDGGRDGRISAARVRLLADAVHAARPSEEWVWAFLPSEDLWVRASRPHCAAETAAPTELQQAGTVAPTGLHADSVVSLDSPER